MRKTQKTQPKSEPDTGLPFVDFSFVGAEPIKVESRLRSLNRALGRGWLTKSSWEIAGPPGAGKSTLALFLAGEIPGVGKLEVMDTENMSLSPSYYAQAAAQGGFRGNIRLIPMADENGELLADTARADMMIETVKTGASVGIVLDSIANYMPTAEAENQVGSSNMGKRAFEMKQIIGKINRYVLIAKGQCVAFYVNHLRPDFSGYGMSSPGGTGKDFGMVYRIRLQDTKDKKMPAEVQRIVGTVTRSKIKTEGLTEQERKFNVIIVPGLGVHVGLTTILDCVDEGLASMGNGVVSMDGVKYGRFSDIAKSLTDFDFSPFIEAAKGIV